MSHVFPRHTRSNLPRAAKGRGVYIVDNNGKQYLDASGGAAVSCLGHSDQDVIAAIQNQAGELAFAHTGFFTTDSAEILADRLIAAAPDGIERVYYTSGGSEAIESALKLARQYYLEIGQPNRRHVIARRQSYHGNTLGALATGGNLWRRAPFAPLMIETTHIAPCYAYRFQRDDESAEDYGRRAADELEDEIQRLGGENVISFVAETVVGATSGAVPPVPGYFKRIREICDRHGVLLILDEVMCGMGRTGHMFACEADGIAPDIIAIAKGLGAGYQPIGAMLCSNSIYDAIRDGSGFFQHGHTYNGHPTACAAANVVVQKLTEGGLVERSAHMGEKLNRALNEAFGQHGYVGDIRGRGMFQALELVENRETKRPFDPERGIAAAVKAKAFENGLICYPMNGTIDGQYGDHILLAPPFVVEDSHIEEIISKLLKSLEEVL